MWRIDEELRRAQNQLLKSANSPFGAPSRNSSRSSLLSKHSSIASSSSRSPSSLSRQSSFASMSSQRTTSTLGSRNAAYQKLTGSNTPPPPTSFNAYQPRSGPVASYTGNTSYGAGYSHGAHGGRSMPSPMNGSSGLGQLSVAVPGVVRNFLRGSS